MSDDSVKSAEEMLVDIKEKLKDRWWRLNNLYWIVNEKGVKVLFKVNRFQYVLYRALWWMNLVLKARQLGITTFVCILFLDDCLFIENVNAAVCADTRDHATEIFDKKIVFPFENLPEWLKALGTIGVDTDSAQMLKFKNGSSIRVATSLRSGTYTRVLISEFGKICAKFPEKAKEIVTGTLNAVHGGGIVVVESTAEGSFGQFYKWATTAMTNAAAGNKLTPLDFKFFFFPWWKDPKYVLDPEGVVITREMKDYLDSVEKKSGVGISAAQRAWYVKKAAQQEEAMKREFPSFPEEAFEAAIEGAYYGKWMETMKSEKRVRNVPFDPMLPVQTWWDIGRDDANSIIFTQQYGSEVRVIDYLEASGEGLPYYATELMKRAVEKGYRYELHNFPHDIEVKEYSTNKTRLETAEALGLRPNRVLPKLAVHDGINAARTVFSRVWIDETNCDRLVKALTFYRKSWDDVRGMWSDEPFHDEWSHGADAFRYMAIGVDPNKAVVVPGASKAVEPDDDGGIPMTDYERHGLVVGKPF